MPSKVSSRSKKKTPSVKKKRAPAKKAGKRYPPGKSKQVPYAGVSLGLLEGKPTTRDGIYVLWLTAKKAMTVTNDFKYINHSDKPNCALTGTEVVTLRKIKPDEELTHDYGW